MVKLDTSEWGEFVIKDLFSVKRPAARSQSDYMEGKVPFVASGNYNNGVLKYLEPKEKEELDKGNCITVSPIDGSAFYQKEDFLGRGGAGSSIIMLYNPDLNLYNGCFIAAVIRAVCSRYAYSDMGSKDSIGAEKIKLPMDGNGNPDFLYMEAYMKKRENVVMSSLAELRFVGTLKKYGKVDTESWGKFTIQSLFEVVKGKRLTKADMREGNIRFIGASSNNNGITAFISNEGHIHPANTITLSYNGSVGEAFYQEEKFWASDDVNVLYPRFALNKYIALFMIPLLKRAGQQYAFIDKWKKEDMEKDFIMLPVDENGNPDFDYMEQHMKHAEEVSKDAINKLGIGFPANI